MHHIHRLQWIKEIVTLKKINTDTHKNKQLKGKKTQAYNLQSQHGHGDNIWWKMNTPKVGTKGSWSDGSKDNKLATQAQGPVFGSWK